MAKDPAFLFYPGDWNLGTMHLTLLEKGCYMELLILQFAKGKFTEAQAKHMLNGSFDLAWATISEKFKTDGKYYWNERLEKEKVIRQKFTQSRRDNASKPKVGVKDGKAYAKHMGKHMEDENKDTNTISTGTWESEKKLFRNAEEWQMKQCTEFSLSKTKLLESMEEFMKELDNKDDYKDIKELKKHWYSWYKFNRNKKPNTPMLEKGNKNNFV